MAVLAADGFEQVEVAAVVAAAGVRYLRQQADHRPTQLEAHA